MISTTRRRNLTAVLGRRYPFMMSTNQCALRSKSSSVAPWRAADMESAVSLQWENSRLARDQLNKHACSATCDRSAYVPDRLLLGVLSEKKLCSVSAQNCHRKHTCIDCTTTHVHVGLKTVMARRASNLPHRGGLSNLWHHRGLPRRYTERRPILLPPHLS